MATQTREVLENENMIVLADGGYYNAQEIDKCKRDNIEVIVSIPNKEKQQKDKGYYLHSDFIYDKESDSFTCPPSLSLFQNSKNTKP